LIALFFVLSLRSQPGSAAEIVVELTPSPVPDNITVLAGDTIRWAGRFQGQPLDIESYAGDFKSPVMKNQGDFFAYALTKPGTYVYRVNAYNAASLELFKRFPGTIRVLESTNETPRVMLVSPMDGFYFSPEDITLQAAFYGPPGTVRWVDFYAGTNWLGRASNHPFQVRYPFADLGVFGELELRAEAVYDSGEVTVSKIVRITTDGARRITLPWRLPTGQWLMYFSGDRGQSAVQSSTNLTRAGWFPSFSISSSQSTAVDEDITNAPLRFYQYRHYP